MKPKSPVWLLLLFTLVLSVNLARAEESTPKVVPLGDDTYSITVSATDKFTRNTEKLKAQAIEAATQYCAKEGRQFKLVSSTGKKSFYLVGDFAKATITFKALSASDAVPAAAPVEAARPAVAIPPATPTDALYDELMKLEELRKKGVLTDEEFTAQKKKVLERSK